MRARARVCVCVRTVHAIWYILISKCDSVINKSLACMHQFIGNSNNSNGDDDKSTPMTSTEKFISLCRWIGIVLLLFHMYLSFWCKADTRTSTQHAWYSLLIRHGQANAMLFYRCAIQISCVRYDHREREKKRFLGLNAIPKNISRKRVAVIAAERKTKCKMNANDHSIL